MIPSTRDYDEEIPMLSHDAFPSVSLDTAGETKTVPKGEKDTETKERSAENIPNHAKQDDHWWTRDTSTHLGGRQ